MSLRCNSEELTIFDSIESCIRRNDYEPALAMITGVKERKLLHHAIMARLNKRADESTILPLAEHVVRMFKIALKEFLCNDFDMNQIAQSLQWALPLLVESGQIINLTEELARYLLRSNIQAPGICLTTLWYAAGFRSDYLILNCLLCQITNIQLNPSVDPATYKVTVTGDRIRDMTVVQRLTVSLLGYLCGRMDLSVSCLNDISMSDLSERRDVVNHHWLREKLQYDKKHNGCLSECHPTGEEDTQNAATCSSIRERGNLNSSSLASMVAELTWMERDILQLIDNSWDTLINDMRGKLEFLCNVKADSDRKWLLSTAMEKAALISMCIIFDKKIEYQHEIIALMCLLRRFARISMKCKLLSIFCELFHPQNMQYITKLSDDIGATHIMAYSCGFLDMSLLCLREHRCLESTNRGDRLCGIFKGDIEPVSRIRGKLLSSCAEAIETGHFCTFNNIRAIWDKVGVIEQHNRALKTMTIPNIELLKMFSKTIWDIELLGVSSAPTLWTENPRGCMKAIEVLLGQRELISSGSTISGFINSRTSIKKLQRIKVLSSNSCLIPPLK